MIFSWIPGFHFDQQLNVSTMHRRQAGISPGTSLCIDESMCAWRGMSLKVEDMLCGLPHATKIVRKPEPVGIELRNLACGA